MKMHKEDLIKARHATTELMTRSIKEMIFSWLALMGASVLIVVFFPDIAYKASGLIWLLLGMTLGIVIGALKAYIIFWDKTEFIENPHGDAGSELQTES